MSETNNGKITVIVNRYGMGNADEELSLLLAKNYFTLLYEENNIPAYICFYAEGVKLTIEGSPVIEELKALESKGAKLLVCKTCLNYYKAVEKVKAGTVATMLDIIGAQQNCTKAITI